MIVVAGEALIDLILHPDGRLAAIPGGGPYNTARTIGRLGGDVSFLGRISSDRFGRTLAHGLEVDGVDLSAVIRTEAPTTLAIAELDEGGSATYRFHTAETAAPELTAGDVGAAMATAPHAFHVGTLGLVLEPIATSLADAVERLSGDTLLMVDPNCRPTVIPDRVAYLARLSRILARADVVKVSADDLAFMAPGSSAVEAARALVHAGARLVLLTNGGRAVHAIAAPFEVELPVPRVEVVDTVGSGDAFGGAFLAWWIEQGLGRDDLADRTAVEGAAGAAIAVAGLTCQRPGADPPTRAEAGWPAR
jgi:fructokinase